MGKNIKKVLNVKLSTTISIIVGVAIIAVILLISIGYQKINVLKNNIENMYTSDVKKVELSRSISDEMGTINSAVKSQLMEYDEHLDSTIKTDIESLNGFLKSYMEITSNDSEKEDINTLINAVSEYSTLWEKISEELKGNTEISSQEKALLYIKEKTATDDLGRVIFHNKFNAQEKYYLSQITAEKAGKEFIVIGISAALILVVISLLIIIYIRSASKKIVNSMEVISSGKLNVDIGINQKNEFGIMSRALDKTTKSVSNIINKIMNKNDNVVEESKKLDDIAREMLSATKEVYSATQVMVDGSTMQAQDLMDIHKQFTGFSSMLNNMIDALNQITDSNKDIHRITTHGEEGINTLLESSKKVSTTFIGFKAEFKKFTSLITQVNDIVSVITGLASQTKLLSLNASIEAARAGEHGKGFGVVADEVNKLSEESRISAEKITKLINTITDITNDILSVTEEMDNELNTQQKNTDTITASLKDIIENVYKSSEKIDTLSDSTNGILKEKDSLVDRVINASNIAEEISSSIEEIAASATQMDLHASKVVESSKHLNNIVDEATVELNKFEIRRGKDV